MPKVEKRKFLYNQVTGHNQQVSRHKSQAIGNKAQVAGYKPQVTKKLTAIWQCSNSAQRYKSAAQAVLQCCYHLHCYIYDAPEPLKTAGTVLSRIIKSSPSDQLSMYPISSSIHLAKEILLRPLLDGRWDTNDTRDAANVADLVSQGKCLF